MHRFTISLVTIAIVGVVACSEERHPTSPTTDLTNLATPRAELLASANGRIERGIEDDILRMEAYVPGLGGAFIENGELVVFVPSGMERSRVLDGLARSSPFLTVDPAQRGLLARGEAIQLRTGLFAFSQLIAWERLLGPELRRLGAISFSDANEGLNRITLGIIHESYRDDVLRGAANAGVPLDAIDIVVRKLETASTTLRDSFSPTGSGVQIANPNGNVCTLGWNVHRGPDGLDGEEGFFTAGHCASAAQPGAGTVGPMYQPTTSNRIGYITQNPLWNVQDPNCDYSYCTQVDAMYVRYDDPSESINRLAQTQYAGTNNGGGSYEWTGWWTDLSGVNYSFFQGATVDKMGRTTGWTRGTLASTCT